MLAVSSPAPIIETLELVRDARQGLKPWQSKGMLLQLLGSLTVAFREGPDLVAAAGFFPLPPEESGEELAEIWLACRPELARNLTAFVKLARLTCLRASQDGTVRLRAFVREGHRPGQRLAVLVGLERVATRNGFELWEWRGGAIRSEAVRHGVEPQG